MSTLAKWKDLEFEIIPSFSVDQSMEMRRTHRANDEMEASCENKTVDIRIKFQVEYSVQMQFETSI